MSVEFKDNSAQVKAQMDGNIKRALTAMGIQGLEFIHNTMDNGYGSPVYDTGTLHRDQQYRVDEKVKATSWGVSKGALSAPYVAWVHEGTSKMEKRPFIHDGIFNNKGMLEETATMHLKQGF